ncbi:MAG: HD domain-containing protein [Flavobacteriaceae bacterium]|nr:HD domain-containing protein [Flavobacteriaceae bacterium]
MQDQPDKNALRNPIFEIIANSARNLGMDCYVIGGYVRDFLLNKKKSKDIDIVCLGDGIALAEEVAKNLSGNPQVQFFKNYGTAMMHYKTVQLEFVGARKESYTPESRNPEVAPGTLEEDQKRRDFTINSLAISLNTKDYGEILDPFNGLQDLADGIIRTPLNPDITYSDDPLRMLRAIRFSSQLHFTIEKESLDSITRNAERIAIISNERIVDELNKILMTEKPSAGFLLLFQTGLLQYILPELTALVGVDQVKGQKHKDNFYHTLQVVDNISKMTDNLWLRWAALLHDIGKAPTKKFDKTLGWTFHGHELAGSKMVKHIFKRLHMPLNEKMKYVEKIVLLSSRPIILAEEVTDSAVRRLVFDAGDLIEDLMTHCEADITTQNKSRELKFKNNFSLVRKKIKEVEERDHIRNFQPPVSGEDIMAHFNLSPCREIGIIKEAIKEAILEGEIENNYAEAHAFMLKKAEQIGLPVPK